MKILSLYYFKYLFFPPCLLILQYIWYSHYKYVIPLILTVFKILFHFFHYFSLCLSVWEVSIAVSSSSLILSLAVSSLLWSPSKAFLISVIVLLIYNISFWLFLRGLISAYIMYMFFHVVYFFTRALIILQLF